MDNVSNIVSNFLDEFEEYRKNRTTIYHIACQIMDTHKKELWEKTLRTRLKRYLKKSKEATIREMVETFLKKYPEYRNDPGKVSQLTAIHITKREKNNSNTVR